MISKLLVLAFVAAVATASEATKQASYVVSAHDDSWCHDHHLGSGATHCVSNNGCCFSDKIANLFEVMSFDDRLGSDFGPCHSCESHMDGWCEAFGAANPNGEGNVWDECVANSGCTYTAERGCHSSAKEPIVTVHNCATQASDEDGSIVAFEKCLADSEAAQKSAEEIFVAGDDFETVKDLPTYRAFLKQGTGCMKLYTYKPKCIADGAKFAPMQKDGIPHVSGDDERRGQYFCVDEDGHEIPNTRKQEPLDTPGASIDCDHFRKKHDGYQCPNAMVLSSSGGVVKVNKANDALDCRADCNNDVDCGTGGWCCFNGCAYTCQTPVKPFTGCANPPVHEVGQTLNAVSSEFEHEMQVVASCENGFSVAQNKGLPDSVTLTCSHGRWLTGFGEESFDLDCEKQCDVFNIEKTGESEIDGMNMNRNDFVIEGDENFFGSERKITCVDNYGVVAGSESVLKTGSDLLECGAGGEWREKFTGNKRSIECSVCFDNADWRDAQQNNCQHYQSRPAECLKGEIGTAGGWTSLTPAQKNCRVACRTCRAAEAQFGVKETRSVEPTENIDNWKKISVKVIKTLSKTENAIKMVTVTKHLPLSQACQKEGSPTLEATQEDGSYVCKKEGYEIAGAAPASQD